METGHTPGHGSHGAGRTTTSNDCDSSSLQRRRTSSTGGSTRTSRGSGRSNLGCRGCGSGTRDGDYGPVGRTGGHRTGVGGLRFRGPTLPRSEPVSPGRGERRGEGGRLRRRPPGPSPSVTDGVGVPVVPTARLRRVPTVVTVTGVAVGVVG